MADDDLRCLPRHGFEGDYDFDSLVERNPFLFRVYTPKVTSPSISYDPKIFCIAPKFDAKYTSPPSAIESLSPIGPLTEIATCEEVTRHLDWTTRSSSPFISTSFSFAWAIWEALRRYKSGVKHDVEIAVIDAASLKGRAATAIQVLRKATFDEQPHHYWRWYHFSQESQSVVVYGYIPLTSVMASVPLLSILEKMPSYFLRSGIPVNPSITETSLINRVAWDFTNKKSTFKQFCEAMTDRYFEQSTEMRLRESIVGSIRLAVALLNPWFHKTAADDIDWAVHKAAELASLIAAWPDPQDPAEMQDVLHGMVSLLAEEVRDKRQVSLLGDVLELAGVIDDIEDVVYSLEDRVEQHETAAAAGNLVNQTRLDDDCTEGTPSQPQPGAAPSLRITIPSTPPSSSSSSSSNDSSPLLPLTPVSSDGGSTETPSKYDEVSLSRDHSANAISLLSQFLTSESSSHVLRHRFSSPATTPRVRFVTAPSTPFSALIPSSPEQSCQEVEPSLSATSSPSTSRGMIAETISVAVTGFLFGTLLTLCVVSSQRRMLLTHLT
ncbi:hypothetical protein ARMSODRAFT_950523 [Armillaria solidipes]|uniref:DUF7587 domain-containing protein n=1 Tax=Armillaria solidipes TaxID=1076256 RepID=A0A2H3CCP9_9AGAR|nr:hypothetical protein ARMSODRAFT_950523 [Armillaria solidipes]